MRGSAAVAARTPPIIAPITPTVLTSLPAKYRFLMGEAGRRYWFVKRFGVGSMP